MEARTLLAGVLALGLLRPAALVALVAVVLATVSALTVGVLLLRLLVG